MARFPQLDILRALAVALVIAFHVGNIAILKDVGWVGVDLFFVLSGFLISGLLFTDLKSTDDIDIKRFWIRRGLKIYPAYIFMMLFLRAVDPRQISYWKEFTFLQNFHGHPWSHTWSLAVEEHFYLALPLLLIWLARSKRLHMIPVIGVSLLVFCFALRSWNVIYGFSMDLAYRGTPCRIDSLFAGVVLGYYFHYHRESIERFGALKYLVATVFALVPCVLLRQNRPISLTIVCTLNIFAFSLLIAWSINQPWMRFRPIELVGLDSYSIYLWHLPVIYLFKTFSPSPYITGAMYFACVIVGILMAQIIEIPLLEFRDRVFPRIRSISIPLTEFPVMLETVP